MERQRRHNRLRAYGRELATSRVPAGPIRQHVLSLLDTGAGLERIADLAGVPRSALLDLKFGRRGRQYDGKDREILTVADEHATKILALTMDDVDPLIHASRGTVRRLRALVAIGWTQTELAELMGMSVGNFSHLILGLRPRVRKPTAARAAQLFTSMWTATRTGAWADNARRIAAARGWVGPLGWDDIDGDPEPVIVEDSAQTKGQRIIEDVEWLLEAGESPEQVSLALSMTAGTIAKLAERYERKDLARPFWVVDSRARTAA
jgi:transcriptional regulator with XRE-family HTH domain